MEWKGVPAHVKAVDGRQVTGIFAVMGNVDSYQDKLMPGAFTKTIAERGGKVKFLWQHDFASPVTAKVISIRELTAADLPPEVLAAAPEATGGAEIVREYLSTPRADEVLAGIKAGVPYEMSFGYDAIKYAFETPPDARDEWDKVRILQEVKLYEVSDVLWGANDATLASKAALPLGFLASQMELHAAALGIKAGARHSSADIKLLNAIHKAAVTLGATQCKGIADDEDAEAEDSAKSRAGRLEAVTLTLSASKLRLLELSI